MAAEFPMLHDLSDPLLGYRFGLFFLGKLGLSHPLDFRFQSVSGLSASVSVTRKTGVGSNVEAYGFPESTTYTNLILKRGKPVLSTLSMEFQKSLRTFQFKPRTVLLSVLNENALPINSWVLSKAYPVKWSLSGLDAEQSNVLIEEMELSYSSFKPMPL